MNEKFISLGIISLMFCTLIFGILLSPAHPDNGSRSLQITEQNAFLPITSPTESQQKEDDFAYWNLNYHPDSETEEKKSNASRGGEPEKYTWHLATRSEIEALKEKIGIREKNKNYNIIYDGLGTGLAPPTEEEWEAMIGTLKIVDSVKDDSGGGPVPLGSDPGATVDLMADPSFPAVHSQGSEGSCASWSTAYYTNGFMQAKDYGWTDQHTSWGSANKDHLMSIDWVYHKVNGGSDSGSNFENPMGVISTLGNCPESYMPYSTSDHTSWGDEDAWRQAPIYRAAGYESTSVENIDVIKSWIDDGYAVPMALNAGQYSKGWTDGNGIMSNAEYTPGSPNHANTVVGYNDSIEDDNETGAFKIVNSWGASWGPYSNGTYYMTYDCFKNLTWSLCYRFSSDKDDYQPSLLGVWDLNPQGARNAPIKMGVGQYGSPEETRAPVLRGGNHNFPSFMCLDITEFQDNWDAGTNTFYLEIGSGASSSTISSFKIERYQGIYTPGSPTETSPESPDTPETTPGYVTIYFPLSKGRVRFDNIAYQSNALAIITLGDKDLNSNSSLVETYVIDEVRSDPSGDSETTTITLTETNVNTGVFIGTIQLMPGVPNINDSVLQVANGDIITVRYEDADNGTGSPATTTDTANVDDDPPIISSVSAIPSYTTATITWNTDEDCDSLVYYSSSTPLVLTEWGTTKTTTHSIELTGLSINTLYYYEVHSTDYAGNTVADDNSSSYFRFTTLPPEIAPWSDDMDSGHEWWANETIGSGTEWQLGDPAGFGPGTAYSGVNCWGTNIDSDYSNLVETWLYTPPIDLTLAANANMTFWNWYDIEKNWDVGVVEISIDLGNTWTRIEPVGGYPDWTKNFGDGYSSESGGWVSGAEEEFDLSPYLGNIVLVGFHFKTDTFVIDPGWYIDNVTIYAEYVSIGATLTPYNQSQIGLPNTTASYPMKVINIGSSNSDIFDLTNFSSSGWTVSYYEADGVTPLGDANTNGIPDTGSLAASGGFLDIIVKVDIPITAMETDIDITTITATSTNDPLVSDDAILATSVPYYIESQLLYSQVTIDGIISPGEWTDAKIVDISSPDASPGNVSMYMKNNETMLYIVVINTDDTSLDSDDRIGIYFDDNHDHEWPDSNILNGEGNFWVRWNGVDTICQYRGIWGDPPNMEPTTTAIGVLGEISVINGYVQYEASIDLTTSALQSTPGSTFGLFVFCHDTDTNTFYGEWPPDVVDTYTDPSTYGDFILAQDTEPPVSSVNSISPYWHIGAPLTITASANGTGGTVKSVELSYRFSANNLTWNNWISLGVDYSSPWEWEFDFPDSYGFYEFKSNATDGSFNVELDSGTDAICGLDIEPPNSYVNTITPYGRATSPITIDVTADDDLSGPKEIELYYRYSGDNSSWNAWIPFGVDTEEPWTWTFDFSDGEGYYEFCSVAKDFALNVEIKTTADAICAFDATPPVVNAGFDTTADEDELLQFDGSGSSDNLGIVNMTWDFGDGYFGYGTNPNHGFSTSGTYIVTLTVTDIADNTATDTVTIYVNNPAPIADAGPNQSVNEGETTFFDGSNSMDTASDIPSLIYTWYFEDGTVLYGITVSYIFKDNGNYVVTLVVRDDNGHTDSDTVDVTVNNVAPSADAQGPYSGEEGGEVEFFGSATDPGDDSFVFEWDFNDSDGITYNDATGPNPSWSWPDDYSGTVYLKVTDDDGGVGFSNASITINNVAPTVDSGGPYSGDEGGIITLASSATDMGSDTFIFEWDMDNDGLYDDATGINPSWSWVDNGAYTIGLRVTDDDGDWGTDKTSVTITNIPPTADPGGPYFGNEGSAVTFTGSATDPGLSDTFTYYWDFGDGGSSAQQNPTHIYDDDGVYTAILKVTDKDGGTDSSSTTVNINNVAPWANAGGPYLGIEGASVAFASTATDPGTDTFTYEWDFDDSNGITYTDATGANPNWIWYDDFNGAVYLRVTDDDGGVAFDDATININNVAPSADSGGPYTGDENSPVTLLGSAVDQGSDTLTFEWDLDNDGYYDDATGQNPSWFWDDEGLYIIGLRVSDDDGGTDESSSTVTIDNLAPTAEANGPYFGNEGALITFTGEGSDPGNDTLTYFWDFGDGIISTEISPSHAYHDNGTYTVTLTVTDNDGGIAKDSTMAIISNLPPVIEPVEDIYSAKENRPFFLKINASDAKGDDITFSDSTEMFEIDPISGVIQFIPTNDDVGIREVIITVTDDDSRTSTVIFLLNIENENQSPTLEQIGPQIATEELQFTLTVHATDEDDGDVLHFFDNSELFVINENTGEISFTPTNDQVGTYLVTITVEDIEGASDQENLTFTVLNTNDEPQLDSILDQHGKVGEKFTYKAQASDVDDDMLIFSDDSDLFAIDPTTGVISFVPGKEDAGVHIINITVTDTHGANHTRTMVLEIEDSQTTPESEPKKEADSEINWMPPVLLIIVLLAILIVLLILHILMDWKARMAEESKALEEEGITGDEFGEMEFELPKGERYQPLPTPPPFPPPPPPLAPLIITDEEKEGSEITEEIEPPKMVTGVKEDTTQKPVTKIKIKRKKVMKRKILTPKRTESLDDNEKKAGDEESQM